MQRLLNKVAIVTGSSSGLGRAIALRYSQEGARVICSDLQPSQRLPPNVTFDPTIHAGRLENERRTTTHELIQARGGLSTFVRADASDASDVEQLVEEAVRWGGRERLDVIANNAGIAIEARKPGKVHETDEETWDTTMRVNAKSVFLGSKYAVKQMLKQGPFPVEKHQDQGRDGNGSRGWIVNISSIYGMVGGLDNPSYSASKGAVANLTRQIAYDYGRQGIHCNAICPGHAETAIFAETVKNMVNEAELLKQYPMGRFGTPDDVAKIAVVLAGDEASWLTGQCIGVDGGYLAR